MLAVTDELTSSKPAIKSGIYRVVPEFRSTLRRELIFWRNSLQNPSQSSGSVK